MERPPIHVVVYGQPGSGKSTFAATFPRPMLVFCFDPLGKEMPYLRLGQPQPVEHQNDIPVCEVTGSRNAVLARIEYYHDTATNSAGTYVPSAYHAFLRRMGSLYDELAAGMWQTVVIDSLTYLELTVRKLAQYELEPQSKDPRRWFAAATDMLEETLLCRFGGYRANVVVLAHVDQERDELLGSLVYNPAAPGRLRTRLGSGYAEMYVSHVRRDDGGGLRYCLQTRADTRYNASSVFLEAPNPCDPYYDALWDVYDRRKEGGASRAPQTR